MRINNNQENSDKQQIIKSMFIEYNEQVSEYVNILEEYEINKTILKLVSKTEKLNILNNIGYNFGRVLGINVGNANIDIKDLPLINSKLE